ncbi:MAG: RluA family pseudouridine synthase [Pseudomonadota bacterium]
MNVQESLLTNKKSIIFFVSSILSGKRLDHLVADHPECADLTRSRIQHLIRSGNILVDDQLKKNGYRVRENEKIEIFLPPPEPTSLIPQHLDLVVLFEDEDLVVVSKPPGLVVHPSHGHSSGTLVHGLLYHCSHLSGVGGQLRPGVVHRLDKDTSGVMVVAKNDAAHQSLTSQFKSRKVVKSYLAILSGIPKQKAGRLVTLIGRHQVHRKKMAVLEHGGREAITRWQVLEEFHSGFAYVKVHLETGRTHQIRVHMAHLGCPIAGDGMYGRKKKGSAEGAIPRQCLHSHRLSFCHPVSGKPLSFEAPLWPDMEEILQFLRKD